MGCGDASHAGGGVEAELIPFPETSSGFDLEGHGLLEGAWDEGGATGFALVIPDNQLTAVEMDIMDVDAEEFGQAQAASVDETGVDLVGGIEVRENAADELWGEDGRGLWRAAEGWEIGSIWEGALE